VDRMNEIVGIVKRNGALEATRQVALAQVEQATAQLAGLPESDFKASLLQLATDSVRRSH
jgi:octaprenyl-diphosphate synthase